MASIGTTLPAGTSGAAAGSSTTTPSSNDNALASQATFLQLLVAQLKNQDPSQPMDGTTFVTQLAQFSTLEQDLASRQDLDSISKDLSSTAASGSTTSTDPTSTTTSGTAGTTGSGS